jgi:4-hydroxythreonine-4-phosphate dehydrogenase
VTPGPFRSAPLALSLGDPAGIGAEIILKAWRALRESGPAFVVVGDYDLLASASIGGSAVVRRVARAADATTTFPDALPVLDSPLNLPVVSGQPSSTYAQAVIRWIDTAVGLALSGEASGLVTAPIAKAPLYAAGFKFPGHTEYLDDLTAGAPVEGERGPVMMLTAKGLRVSLVTIHTPLAKVPSEVTAERVARTLLVTAHALKHDFGVAHPRLVLAGLNPHAGEDGKIGREEVEVLKPTVEALRRAGVDVRGPLPADTLFHEEARATYDAAVCCYHDQGLIPVKSLDFFGGVNVTLGLPIVRTSPDHGTGFDIAGRGLARPDSLIAAVRLAGEMAERRQAAQQA